MKLQNLTVIFVIIILPIILITSLYITTGIKTIKYQSLYDTGLLTATHDAIYAFEINTANNDYSDNAETKRNILKSSIKAFEKSLCNTCGISAYNTYEIEEYIPAIVFGMYDGFYMYAPSKKYNSNTYSHSLKNYVYYSETLDDGTVIIYSLDNYVTVSGEFDGEYKMKSGYLIDLNGSEDDGSKYKNIEIDNDVINAREYYKESYHFTDWFLNEAEIQNKKKDGVRVSYLDINNSNDPEKEDSLFVQHKRKIIKDKIESVLNSSITAYSEKILGQTYKMPKLSVDDWEKIYSNISMLTFFQGKSIGLTKYNGYCVLNSTNSNEYVNPNLMYFIDENMYHDIRCKEIAGSRDLQGFKIGSFGKKKIEVPKQDDEGNVIIDENGNTEYQYEYIYNHKELACYDCINDSIETDKTVYQYVENSLPNIKTAYWTSLASERYNQIKLLKTDEQISLPEKITWQGKVLSTTANTDVYDEYGNKIVVPAGFMITEDASHVTEGIVIEDCTNTVTKGSQFVWIPVGTVYTNLDKTESKTISLDRYTFATDGTPTAHGDAKINTISSYYYQELETSSYGNEPAKDISGFISSAKTNGGYYIGRYEAGDSSISEIAQRKGNMGTSTEGTLVCKANQVPYNWILQKDASSKCQNMYTGKSYTSDLVNSYAWDTAIVFIQKFSNNSDANMYSNLNKSTGYKKTGGNGDKYCNINDMSGNAREWTTETSLKLNPWVSRGGYYDTSYKYNVTCTRPAHWSAAPYSGDRTSFRPILYF